MFNFLVQFSLIISVVFSGQKSLAGYKNQPQTNTDYYTLISKNALEIYQQEVFVENNQPIDFVFLKLEKKINFKKLDHNTAILKFNVNILTQDVSHFLTQLSAHYNLAVNSKLRKQLQNQFYGLSQSIKKANELNLSIDSDYFDRLHDSLIGQSTALFYASHNYKFKHDLFFTSYYLNELKYPVDLTAKHVIALQKKSETDAIKYYLPKIARVSLLNGQQINKFNSNDLEALYLTSMRMKLDDFEIQTLQKSYLKQLQGIGDQEKINAVKKSLASTLLLQESKYVISHPLDFFKYIQFLVGYIFVAWPLEVILILVSLMIFGLQSRTVLTHEERCQNSFGKRIWLMFTKAYLGSNVPFFSKLAASLILFGVGLYFNSAKNFVESLMISMN